MKTGKIDVGDFATHLPSPKAEGVRDNACLSFGFSYFKQTEHFGLNRSSTSWSVSFLERLSVLSKEKWDDLIGDPTKAQSLRFHPVDWNASRIPITQTDLTWLPQDYISNPDFPFYQFHVSKALGRFMGFRDESGVFQIVLVDPLHNLQPSKQFGYRTRPCGLHSNDLDIFKAKVDKVLQTAKCNRNECSLVYGLQELQLDEFDVLLLQLAGDDLEIATNLVRKGKCKSLYDAFAAGLLVLMAASA